MSRPDRFIRACRRESVDATPVWLMRQAGRYLPEYRSVRERYGLLEICRRPELAVEVTLQPLRRFELDAAILFSDLLIPLEPLGIPFSFVRGEGPRIESPIDGAADVERLRDFDPREELDFTLEAIRLLRKELEVPLVGFAGAPFTLASYAIEGGPSKSFEKTKALMFQEPSTWHRLAERLAATVTGYLEAQIEAGVQAVQLFDSWVGALAPIDYRELVFPHVRSIFAALSRYDVPRILFGTGTAGLLSEMAACGADVLGLDWRIDLERGWRAVGERTAVQGNLDPAVLCAPREILVSRIESILQQAGGRTGHVFNLGHGVLPHTPVDNVSLLVEHVHRASSRESGE
ncbi:MAG TPA: uroporphyrinogen decarboxylase [Vicinamibacteria bacterium]|nr:uroporphyrinogen decarboxylase [Vicinamibacteria bacterium]